jgi:uncharacterized protein (TIGR01244 family)
LLLAGVGSCSREAGPVRPEEVVGPETWGGVSNVTHVRDLWFAAQPDDAALEAARDHGIGVVIDLREPGEREWDEQGAVESLGMTYHRVPVPKGEPFPPEAIARIDALVADAAGPVLLHCSTGNRAAGWYAIHLVEQQGMSLDDALAVGRKVGITKDEIVRNVARHLGEPVPADP